MTRMQLVNDMDAPLVSRDRLNYPSLGIWSMTWMHFGQWHECMLLSVNHTQSMTPMLTAMCNIHSALIPECDLDSAKFSWVWFTLSAFLSLTMSLTAFKLCNNSHNDGRMQQRWRSITKSTESIMNTWIFWNIAKIPLKYCIFLYIDNKFYRTQKL